MGEAVIAPAAIIRNDQQQSEGGGLFDITAILEKTRHLPTRVNRALSIPSMLDPTDIGEVLKEHLTSGRARSILQDGKGFIVRTSTEELCISNASKEQISKAIDDWAKSQGFSAKSKINLADDTINIEFKYLDDPKDEDGV